MRRVTSTIAMTGLALGLLALPAAADPPRPGCGYGDDNHQHQAAPGRDPMDLRPGNGTGDANHDHTVAPGQGPDVGPSEDSPRRGCNEDPTA